MNDLIAKLEAATGPDRRLDDAIHVAVRGRTALPPYTKSIDAALMLVPQGFQAYVDTGVGYGDAHACVWADHPHRIQGGARQQATPAIALCIAALKAARHAQSPQRPDLTSEQ